MLLSSLRLPVFINFCALLLVAVEASVISKSCEWPSGTDKLEGYIPGVPSNVSVTNGAVECRDACMSQSTFICAAVNYRVSDGLCELLSENDQTASAVEPFDGSWLYFIRPLCAGIWLPWHAEKGIRIFGLAFTDSDDTMLQDCMSRCLRYTESNECRAINLRTSSTDNKNCKLRDGRVGDNDTETRENPNWQYFNRPSWYLDSSPGTMKAEITDLGNIGYSMYIFTELRIPVDGYLVAWQYYMNTKSPCTSYAAIWREVEANSYKLISKIRLTPEQPTEAGVRFQFIQNEVIRVRSGDIIAVHTEKGLAESGCAYNMVAGNYAKGGETIEFLNSFNEINVSRIKTYARLNLLPMTPALKAYVSEYLTLPAPPQIIANSSNSPAGLTLRFPDLPPVDESAVVVGFKVKCSTDAMFNEIVPCYNDSLVPVSTRNVVLNLPDEPMTYHIAVQIVRNFNGELLFEDRNSTTSYKREAPKMSMEMILIIGLGAGGGCLLLGGLILIICCCVRRRRGNNTTQHNADRQPTGEQLPTPVVEDVDPDNNQADYESVSDSGCNELTHPQKPCSNQQNKRNQIAEAEYDEAQAEKPRSLAHHRQQYYNQQNADDQLAEAEYDEAQAEQLDNPAYPEEQYYNQQNPGNQIVEQVYYDQVAGQEEYELPPRTHPNMSNRH